jgi:hypothetical protein
MHRKFLLYNSAPHLDVSVSDAKYAPFLGPHNQKKYYVFFLSMFSDQYFKFVCEQKQILLSVLKMLMIRMYEAVI